MARLHRLDLTPVRARLVEADVGGLGIAALLSGFTDAAGRCARAQVGARFRGTSRNGWRRWTTTSTIADVRDGERFAWEVTYFGLPVARWEYRLENEGDAVRLVEAVDDRRGRFLRAASPLITGSPDRDRRNADTMKSTLEAIKAAAETLGH